VVEPGLAPLCWPLAPAAFLRDHLRAGRALVSHPHAATQPHAPPQARAQAQLPRHLESLARELHGLSVPALLREATRTVAWLRDARTGRMAYVECPDAAVAGALYAAGHSLYFNPSIAFQRKYMRALCADLELDFGAAMDVGGVGGDVEVRTGGAGRDKAACAIARGRRARLRKCNRMCGLRRSCEHPNCAHTCTQYAHLLPRPLAPAPSPFARPALAIRPLARSSPCAGATTHLSTLTRSTTLRFS
jgi:hypothetical protein